MACSSRFVGCIGVAGESRAASKLLRCCIDSLKEPRREVAESACVDVVLAFADVSDKSADVSLDSWPLAAVGDELFEDSGIVSLRVKPL